MNILGIDLGRYRDRIDILAASITVVEFGVDAPKLKQLGDRCYLSPELQAQQKRLGALKNTCKNNLSI